MSGNHNHAIPNNQNEKTLWGALALTGTFLIAEFIGGILLNSLALLSDAAHMLTDAAALGIALAAVRIAKKATDKRRTYGYHRFEILAATFNALMLFGVAIYILIEAWQRFQNPVHVQSTGMMVIASLGLIINLISMKLLTSGKDKSINLKGAYLEVWSDMLGSLGVILGGVIIYFTNWLWVDTMVAIAIGLWVLPRTWVLLKESLNLLLEGVPEGINITQVEEALLNIPGVLSLHELHVWGITSGKSSLSCHLLVEPGAQSAQIYNDAEEVLETEFSITHSTLQLETTPCRSADNCTLNEAKSGDVHASHDHDH